MSAYAFQGAAIPVSSAAGPFKIDVTAASGFAHTELGAAMAALHLSVRTDPATGPAVFTPAINAQTVGASSQLLATRNRQYQAMAKASRISNGLPIIAPTGAMEAYKIAAYSPDQPTQVHLLVQIPSSGKYVDIAPSVQWDATTNDYKLVAVPGGSWPSTPADPSAGYTKFLQ